MKKVLKKRTGFTLVELLIVIIIIGILAGAMLLVAGSGTDKAEATKVVSDLRGLKAAALMYYADNPNSIVSGDVDIDKLKKYMDRNIDVADYEFSVGTVSGDAEGGWFVGQLKSKTAGVKDKLKAMAIETGLLKNKSIAGASIADGEYYDGVGNNVYMRAR
jgi:general secretion pathway protein G